VKLWADRFGLAVGYAAALAVGWFVAGNHEDWLDWASTNLANLGDHPVSAMVGSAFVTEDPPFGWIALALVGLGATGWVLGAWRTAVLVSAAHVIGTLVSEGILAYRIHIGAAPGTDRHLLDIGPSYVVVCALAAGIAYGTWPGRILSAIGFVVVSPNLFGGLSSWEVSSVGHVTSIAVALALGWPLARSARRRLLD
jgi:hypothetical protein